MFFWNWWSWNERQNDILTNQLNKAVEQRQVLGEKVSKISGDFARVRRENDVMIEQLGQQSTEIGRVREERAVLDLELAGLADSLRILREHHEQKLIEWSAESGRLLSRITGLEDDANAFNATAVDSLKTLRAEFETSEIWRATAPLRWLLDRFGGNVSERSRAVKK